MADQDESDASLVALLAAGFVIAGIILGYGLGFSRGRVATERKAIEAGAAYYAHTPESECGVFTFKK
jgi:hypothetical protein